MELNPTPVSKKARVKRLISVLVIILAIISGLTIEEQRATQPIDPPPRTQGSQVESTNEAALKDYKNASDALAALAVKGRAPKTGYTRAQFGNGWSKNGGCDVRNQILARDLADVLYEINSCIVLSGKLNDPYTGKQISFTRGSTTSGAVQIDHVVALSDAWQKGAQLLSPQLREKFANDGLNLLAVDGSANQNKSDGDAATWLPANKSMRCAYIARQISVKLKYTLWVTSVEKRTMEDILKNCPNQQLAL